MYQQHLADYQMAVAELEALVGADHGTGEDDDATLENTLPATGDTPSDSAECEDLASAVRDAIQTLLHNLKTVVLLFEYQEQGYEEIVGALAHRSQLVGPANLSIRCGKING